MFCVSYRYGMLMQKIQILHTNIVHFYYLFPHCRYVKVLNRHYKKSCVKHIESECVCVGVLRTMIYTIYAILSHVTILFLSFIHVCVCVRRVSPRRARPSPCDMRECAIVVVVVVVVAIGNVRYAGMR